MYRPVVKFGDIDPDVLEKVKTGSVTGGTTDDEVSTEEAKEIFEAEETGDEESELDNEIQEQRNASDSTEEPLLEDNVPAFIVDPDVDLTSAGLLDLHISRRREGTQVDSSSQQSGASNERPAKRPKVIKTADIDFKLLGFF